MDTQEVTDRRIFPCNTQKHYSALKNIIVRHGTDTLEIQKDAIKQGDRVVVLDDLLATGGTLSATIKLLRQCGAIVPLAAGIVELTFLNGRSRLDVPFTSLIQYDQ